MPHERAGPATRDRTGLDPVEVALLDALDLLEGYAEAEPVRCSDVLLAVERLHGIGSAHAWPELLHLGAPWLVHLPLVELLGDAGSQRGDAAAPPDQVEARLSELGVLALAAERDEVGPVPIGLVEGSLHRGGPVPPFAPWAVVGALLAGSTDAGVPVLPTGGTVGGDLAALLAGEPARLTLGCTIVDEIDRLVITEVPLGVAVGDVVEAIDRRLRRDDDAAADPARRGRRHAPVGDGGIHEVLDESSPRFGLRIVLPIERRTNVARAVEWLRTIRPVTIEVDCRLPAPMPARLSGWDRGDGTGLRALADHLRPGF